jgi:hypothetical protein
MTTTPEFFVVAFEHAQRAFKCVRLEWGESPGAASTAAQWIVTIAGRPVYSFGVSDGDTKESVQSTVIRWWDARAAAR